MNTIHKQAANQWEQVGIIGVDSGRCWVGDPCYANSADDDYPDEPTQYRFDAGHPGAGVCVPTGCGDGIYPVFVKRTDEGQVAAVTVQFIADGDQQEDARQAD